MSNIISRLRSKNIITILDLLKEHEKPIHKEIVIDTRLAITKIPKEYRTLLLKSKKTYTQTIQMHSISLNKWKPIQNTTTREIYIRLLSGSKASSVVYDLINKRHRTAIGDTNRKNPFTSIKRITNDIRLQNVQYKILHNAYPTMAHLFKWKIKSSPMCTKCNQVDDLKHTIYECYYAVNTLNNFRTIIKDRMGVSLDLSYCDILLGLATKIPISQPTQQSLIIDKLLIIIKRAIILQRENKHTISIPTISSMISYQYNINQFNAKNNVQREKIRKQWSGLNSG